MPETSGNVKLKVFIWALSVITLLITGLCAISSSALVASNDNKTKIEVIDSREIEHFREIKEDLTDIKKDIKILINK